MRQELLGLKIGGSVITDKAVPYKAKRDVIRSIAKSLKAVEMPLLIAHGSGSFGHTSAQKYGGKNGYTHKWGIAKVARDAQEINRILMDIFIEEGLPVISFSPRSLLLTEEGRPVQFLFAPIEEALKQGLIPVMYGDVIWDTKQKTTIFSGETLLNLICQHLQRQDYQISDIIQLCNVPGVLDERKQIIPEINQKNWSTVKDNVISLQVADVTGGMSHKIEDALVMTGYGIKTMITHSNSVVFLQEFFEGKYVKGTLIR
ncbi:MAG: isopentenyl phosphate kinase [Candidatus Levyibacteriota bacterium]